VAGVRTVYLKGRSGLTATVLKNGTVLFAGGVTASAVNLAEVYVPSR
jgi:hypothetical protein